MTSDFDEETDDHNWRWRLLWNWRAIALFSCVLLFLTRDPLLTGILPYLRAGWPAVQTAFWLKAVDPWKARGTVGMLFHLCMAGFRAGVCGFLGIVGAVIGAMVLKQEPSLGSFAIAVGAVLGGCLTSLVLGGIGIVTAVRTGVRIYVVSNLYHRCHGDFDAAKTLSSARNRINPATVIIAIATATPLLAFWFGLIVAFSAGNAPNQPSPASTIVLRLLPLVPLGSIAMIVFLSKRIIANCPAECWGAEIPIVEDAEMHWYQA